jgi:hypothetical protein
MEIKILIIIIILFKKVFSSMIYISNCTLNSSVTGILKFKDNIQNLNISLISYESFDVSQSLSFYIINSTLFIYNIYQLRKYNYFKINLFTYDFIFEFTCYNFNRSYFEMNINKNIDITSSIIEKNFLLFIFDNFTLLNNEKLSFIILEKKNLKYKKLNQYKISKLINSKKNIYEKNLDHIENNIIYIEFPIKLINQKLNYIIILFLNIYKYKYFKFLNFYEFSFNETITIISGTNEENYIRNSIYLYIFIFFFLIFLISLGIFIQKIKNKEKKLKKKYILSHLKKY